MLDETIKRKVHWTLEKWEKRDTDGAFSLSPTERKEAGYKPDEIVEWDGNLALNAGLGEMIDLLCGLAGSPVAYDNANAYMYVGDDSTAAAATQTDLQASTNLLEKAMDSGYPARSGQTVTWKSTYGSSEANFAWEEGGVKNGTGVPSATIILLNRKVQSLGTKSSGSVWTLGLDITFS